jgi:hypothetical protein
MSGTGTSKGSRPKTGGRQKGTPNRSTLVLRQKHAELGCDPVAELVRIAREPDTHKGDQVNIYSSFMRYTHPLPKPISSLDEESTTNEPEISLDDALAWAHFMINHYGARAPKEDDQIPSHKSREQSLQRRSQFPA